MKQTTTTAKQQSTNMWQHIQEMVNDQQWHNRQATMVRVGGQWWLSRANVSRGLLYGRGQSYLESYLDNPTSNLTQILPKT
jgi:hypothetical protein